MKKIPLIIAFVLIAALGALLVCDICGVFSGKPDAFRIYFGTTSTAMSQDEVQGEIVKACNERVGGYTLTKGTGGNTDSVEVVAAENTFILTLFFTDIGTAKAIADDVMKSLGETSVVIEATKTQTEIYYAG